MRRTLTPAAPSAPLRGCRLQIELGEDQGGGTVTVGGWFWAQWAGCRNVELGGNTLLVCNVMHTHTHTHTRVSLGSLYLTKWINPLQSQNTPVFTRKILTVAPQLAQLESGGKPRRLRDSEIAAGTIYFKDGNYAL